MNRTCSSRAVTAFYPMMIVPGIVLLLAPSTVETIMVEFGFRESMGGLLQVSYFVGGVIGILLITLLMQKYDTRRIIMSQVLLLSASLLAAATSPWYALFLVFFAMAGFANGILITFPGVYVTRFCVEASHRNQNMLYSFFALGVVTGPILSAFLIDRLNWRWAFAVPAFLILALSIPAALAGFEPLEGVDRLSRNVIARITEYDGRLFYGLLASVLLYIAAESAVSMWVVTFLHQEHGVGLDSAHWVLTGIWAGITLGRFICGFLMRKVDPFRILVFLSFAALVLLVAAPRSGSVTAVVMYPLVGLFYSGIYPSLIGYVACFPDDLSSSVFTVFLAAGAAGGAVLPYFVGLVNQFWGLVPGMTSIAVPILGVLLALFLTRPRISNGLIRRVAGPAG